MSQLSGAAARLDEYLREPRMRSLYDGVRQAHSAERLIAHGWDHVHRDVLNAVHIGEAEGADMGIVLPATILHDIGFLYDPNPGVHHTLGAERCHEWLGDWPEAERRRMARCILVHKGRMRQFALEPENLEEQVVCDADMLEKAGWLGVLQGVRTFAEFARNGQPQYRALEQIARTLAETRSVRFYTESGRRLAEARGGYLRAEICQKALAELAFYR